MGAVFGRCAATESLRSLTFALLSQGLWHGRDGESNAISISALVDNLCPPERAHPRAREHGVPTLVRFVRCPVSLAGVEASTTAARGKTYASPHVEPGLPNLVSD